MSPETVVALLLFVCVFGLIGLGVGFFLVHRRIEGRLESLSHILDTLDERTIHEYTSIAKSAEETRSKIVALGKEIGENLTEAIDRERTERAAKEKELYEIAESIKKELEREREERSATHNEIRQATESLSKEHFSFKETVEEKVTKETQRTLSNLSQEQTNHRNRLEEFEKHVYTVRFRNEMQIALSHLSSGEPKEAAQVLNRLVEEASDSREVVLLAAKANRQSNELEKAERILSEARKRFPSDPDILADLARICALLGKTEEQWKLIAEGLGKSSGHPRLHFERALAHIARENYSAARDDLNRVLEAGVDTAEVRYNLGIANISIGDIPGGISELRRSISLDPMSDVSNHALGLALLNGERYLEAVDFLSRARDLKPDDVTVRLDLAAAFRLSGYPKDALKECAISKQLDPRVARTSLEEALAHHDLAEFQEALECLDNLLQWRPKDTNARRVKAEILTEIERLDEAVQEWSTLVQQMPDDAEIKAALGDALKKVNQPQAALGWLEIAARMAPDNPHLQLRFAKEALAQNKLELVKEVVDAAYPRATTPQSRLQFLEVRLLLILKFERWPLLDRVLSDLEKVLTTNPEVIPLERGLELDGEDLLNLGLRKEAAKIHSGLISLYNGEFDYPFFDELVTDVMRSLLPPAPVPQPRPPVEAASRILEEEPENGREATVPVAEAATRGDLTQDDVAEEAAAPIAVPESREEPKTAEEESSEERSSRSEDSEPPEPSAERELTESETQETAEQTDESLAIADQPEEESEEATVYEDASGGEPASEESGP